VLLSGKTLSVRIQTLSLPVSVKHRSELKALDASVFGSEAAWGDVAFDSSIRGKFEVSVLACVGTEVAGFAVASRSDDESVHIHRIAVAPAFRNERIGRQLVNAVEGRAVEAGASRVTLEFAATLGVAGFYDSLGYHRASASDVREYLKRKDKLQYEQVYLPLHQAQRLVYFRSIERAGD
jgi:ribosomal protein S18 acetylase RimI-like enzyme